MQKRYSFLMLTILVLCAKSIRPMNDIAAYKYNEYMRDLASKNCLYYGGITLAAVTIPAFFLTPWGDNFSKALLPKYPQLIKSIATILSLAPIIFDGAKNCLDYRRNWATYNKKLADNEINE